MTAYTGQKLLDALDSHGLGDWQGLPDCIGARFLTGDFGYSVQTGAAAVIGDISITT